MKYITLKPEEDFYQDTITWIAWESSIQKKYEENLSIVAWIHSHVPATKYCKTKIEIYEDIEKDFGSDMLGIVVQMNKENEPNIYYFTSKSENGRFKTIWNLLTKRQYCEPNIYCSINLIFN